ncbi:SDR family NAD(P)-dependent oxidoreductase [Candidatus Latescibacterota bacterium]
MDFDFTNMVVFVTGSSRGIGRAIALQFARLRAQVVVHYHKNHRLAEQTLADLPGDSHLLVQADLSNPAAVKDMTTTVIRKIGRINILVNNAGIYEELQTTDCTYEKWQDTWERTIRTNLTGPANLSFCIIQHMIEHGGGKIVNVSSRGAFRGEPNAPAYGASKAGLNALSQSLAQALAPYNIFIYAIAPSFVHTEMTDSLLSGSDGDSIRHQSPLGRTATTEEIAHTVVFLASKVSDYLTGGIVDINGASYLH